MPEYSLTSSNYIVKCWSVDGKSSIGVWYPADDPGWMESFRYMITTLQATTNAETQDKGNQSQ